MVLYWLSLWTLLVIVCSQSMDFQDEDFMLSLLINDVDRYVPKYKDTASIFMGVDPSSGCLCRLLPDGYTICSGRDRCMKVPKYLNVTTKEFKLTNTYISKLKPGDFSKMNNLTSLYIEGNFNLSSILPGTFKENVNIRNMSISFNPLLTTLEQGTFEGLVNVRTLYLLKNGFTVVGDIVWTLSPIYLPSLVKLWLNENKFTYVNENDFITLSNSTLEELSLILCRLQYIHPNAFAPLVHLQVLRLGENSFNTSTITNVIKRSIDLGLPLRLLTLYSVGFRSILPKELLKAVAKSNITSLNLARNQFEVISFDCFPYMPRLEELDLREVLALEVTDDAFKNLPNLRTLLLSGNYIPTIPKGVLLPNLTYLDLQKNSGEEFSQSYFDISNGIFSNMTELIYLNLNFNRINHLFNRSFEGLEKLQVLGLRNATIFHIQNYTFAFLKQLVLLNLENNFFFSHSYPIGISPSLFVGLDSLKVLLLGGCGITHFSTDNNPLEPLRSLIHLGLQKNKILRISSSDFAPLSKLETINLSFNMITSWAMRIFIKNKHLKKVYMSFNKLTYFTEAMLDDFTNLEEIELVYNSFECTCSIYNIFHEWCVRNPNNSILGLLEYKADCIAPLNFTVTSYYKSVKNHTIDCDIENKKLIILLPSALLLVCFLSLALTVYFYRWHIKYWIFLTRLYLSRKGKLKSNRKGKCHNNYIYDAFVSYSTEDRNFVVKMVAMLENYEPHLKLCVYERDFQIGSVISESVLESVALSRRTLLVISDNYAKSQWCRWETQLAEHHRLFFENSDGEYVDDALILVKLGPISKSHMTPTLKYLLKTRIYLKWESDDKKQKEFWEKLRSTLAPPKEISESTYM